MEKSRGPSANECSMNMKNKSEKQQKFHEAFTKIFFPPQPIVPQTPQQIQTQEEDVEDEVLVFVPEHSDANSDSDVEHLEGINSSADMSECVPEKLTRSQRKRIKRRKLKEAASRGRKIIGPLLPSTHEDTKDEPCNLEQEATHGKVNETAEALEDSCIDRRCKLQET